MKNNEIIANIKNSITSQGAHDQILSWQKAPGMKRMEVPAGSFECFCMEPVFSEKYTKQMSDYRKALKDQGMDDSQIETQTAQSRHEIYYSNQIPQMIPLMATIRLLPWLDSFENIEGGLVEREHLLSLKLVDYSK